MSRRGSDGHAHRADRPVQRRGRCAPGTPRCVAADVHGREEFATPWQLAETRAGHRAEQRDRVKALYAGFEDGRVVVAGEFQASNIDTPDHASLQVFTHPDHHGRGHGLGHARAPRGGGRRAGPHGAERRGGLALRRRSGRARDPHGRLPHRSRLPVRARGRAPDPRPPGRRCTAGRAGRRGGAAPRGVHAEVVGRAGPRRHRRGASRRSWPCSWSRLRPATWSGSRRAPTSMPCGDARS